MNISAASYWNHPSMLLKASKFDWRKLRCTWFSIASVLLALSLGFARAADYPDPVAGDFVIRNFHFADGGTLPELNLHYWTIGKPVRDAKGIVRNAVLITHGTGGSGRSFLNSQFAGELFGAGQLLDGARYFIILPDGIGHGLSTTPSGGLHAAF